MHGRDTIETVYKQFCRERFPLPSESQVAAIEIRLRILLPPDYRRYLLSYNGGIFSEPRIESLTKECPSDRLTIMGGIGATHAFAELAPSMGGGLTPAIFDDNDPPQLLPIGDTMMGNLILIHSQPHAEDWGRISLKTGFSDKIHFLADGIEGFFDLLSEPRSSQLSG
jgi:SMI1-KNR4 cell-wall